MGWTNPKGFNFRSTAAFVTDGTNETSVLAATTYPTTRTVNGESVTFGWESGTISGRDRTTAAANAPELSGANFFGATATFRVDLPVAGTYPVNCAFGDEGSEEGVWWEIEDTSSVLTTVGSATTAPSADHYYDASGNLWASATAWKSSAVAFSGVFATTILRLAGLDTTFFPNNVIAHMDVTPPSSGGTTIDESDSDALSLSDSVTTQANFAKSASDNVSLTDSVSVSNAIAASVSDALALTDSVSSVKLIAVAVSDSLTLSVSLASQLSGFNAVSDSLALVDTAVGEGGGAVAATPSGPTPAGSSRKRRHSYVEIDGQRFAVDGPEHARALLERAREVAANHARGLAEAAVAKAPRRGTKPVAIATPRIESPDPELAPVIREARLAINKLYRETALDVELAALMHKHLAQEDEDEELLLLM